MLFSICLHIKSDNKSLINFYTSTLIRLLQNYPIKISSPISFPIKITKYTVLRSPHIYKKAREQFEYRTFSYLIHISFDRSLALYKHLFFLLTFLKYQLPSGLALKFTNNIQF